MSPIFPLLSCVITRPPLGYPLFSFEAEKRKLQKKKKEKKKSLRKRFVIFDKVTEDYFEYFFLLFYFNVTRCFIMKSYKAVTDVNREKKPCEMGLCLKNHF